MLAENNPLLAKAYNELRILSNNEEMRTEYEARIKAKRDEISRLEGALAAGEAKGREEGRTEGRTEGRVEGIKEGKAEIVKNMLKRNVTVEDISRLTGLSVDRIMELKTYK